MTPDGYVGPKQHMLVIGCLLLSGLVLAFAPHAVLGLQYQCMLHRLTGLRCPFCGMTRDFILMWHGSLPQYNPGSLLMAVALYLVYPVWLIIAARREGSLAVNREKLVSALVVAMAVLFVCNNLVS